MKAHLDHQFGDSSTTEPSSPRPDNIGSLHRHDEYDELGYDL